MATTIRASLCPVVVASRNHCTGELLSSGNGTPGGRSESCGPPASTAERDGPGQPGADRGQSSGQTDQDAGQLFSTSVRTCWVGLSLAIQLVSSVQSVPAPTSPGIRSDPSKAEHRVGVLEQL